MDKSDPQSFQSGLDMVWGAGGSRLSHTMVVHWQTLVSSEGSEFTGEARLQEAGMVKAQI